MANQVSNVINSMRLKRLQKQLVAVNRLSDQMRNCSDEALQAKTADFKQRLEKRETTRINCCRKLMQRFVKHRNVY